MSSSSKSWMGMLHSLILVSLLFFGSVIEALTVTSTVLVISKDVPSSRVVTAPLDGYGIPYEVLAVPQGGVIRFPTLNSTTTEANYGLIVVLSAVAYDYGSEGGGWRSALSTDQWTELRNFQKAFAVRMIHLDVYPGPDYGATALGGCCNPGTIQLAKLTDNTAFPTAGLKTGALISMEGLWHYPASISDASSTSAFLQFEPVPEYPSPSFGGVINQFPDGREQMAFFTSFATWSVTSTYLSHIWIHWGLRGTYPGIRRVRLSTQVDDVFLATPIYDKNDAEFRSRPSDLEAHKSWTPAINAKMNPGSDFFVELAYNGNGNLAAAALLDTQGNVCANPIEYEGQPGTALEFRKPLGTGSDVWSTNATYVWTEPCTSLDPLRQWFSNAANRDAFAHVSHTFTHLSLNNATYSDCFAEISFNQQWLSQTGLASSSRFSAAGLIPPAITGLHNGDCLKAWWDRGIRNAVGDNTRPPLRNQESDFWPLTTTMANNGFDGFSITPRFASNIYYNCDTPACTVLEWTKTAAGQGDIYKLLQLEKTTNTRYLLGLRQDPYMFHQANMRQGDVDPVIINGQSASLSLLQMWVETIVQEMVRLVDWPIITDKHDDINISFQQRMQRDMCAPKLKLTIDDATKKITGVQVLTNGNSCPVKIPVTVPNTVTDTQGFTTERRGNDPLTIWVDMKGSPVSFDFGSPVPVKIAAAAPSSAVPSSAAPSSAAPFSAAPSSAAPSETSNSSKKPNPNPKPNPKGKGKGK